MRFPVRLAAAGAVFVGASLAVVVPGGIAAAKGQVKGTCTSLSGSASTQTLSGCTDPADTGGGGTISTVITGMSGTSTISWTSGKSTTESVTFTELTGKKDKCPAIPGDTSLAEAKSVSTVTGGTATDLIGPKALKSTSCAYNTPSGILVQNFPGKTTPF